MNLDLDWRKQAAAATLDKPSMEQAFMAQAQVVMGNKCGPLMTDPYFLGFEIVYKNDTDDRLVGIFAFRVNRELFYAPTFFLSGEIKGVDLFYRVKTKSFYPNDEDWAQYWTEAAESSAGSGISKLETAKLPTNVAIDKLAQPPYAAGGVKSAAAESWDAFLDEAATLKDVEPGAMVEFAADTGVGLLEKLAAAIEASYPFANALNQTVDMHAVCEASHLLQKEASTPVEPEVRFFNQLDAAMTDEAREMFFKFGYSFNDKRDQSALTAVYANGEASIATIGEAGVYDVLGADGITQEAFVAPLRHQALSSELSSELCGVSYPGEAELNESRGQAMVVVFSDGKVMTGRKVFGEPMPDGKRPLLEQASSGKAYRVFDEKAGTLSQPFYVDSKRTRAGVTLYDVVWEYGSSKRKTLRQNPDFEEGFVDDAVGTFAKFVEVKTSEVRRESDDYLYFREEDGPALASDNDFRSWVLKDPEVKEATIKLRPDTEDTSISLNGVLLASDLEPKQAASVLIDMGVPAAQAAELVGKTGHYFFKFASQVKAASYSTRLNHIPNFSTSSDSNFGVQVQTPEGFVVSTHTPADEPPGHRVGDAWDPSGGTGPQKDKLSDQILQTATPEQLAQLAKTNKLPSVFEHGVIGSLVKTFDSAGLIDKYIPKLLDALDAQGRILFLFYWKPKDFQKSFGVDDMTELESDILSNFRSFGAICLTLMKQSKRDRPGSVPL